MMEHSDFQIGLEFFTEMGRWRCTDVGTRVIVAISLEPGAMVQVTYEEDGERKEKRLVSDAPSLFAGPPYAVAEHVFDEYDLDGCYATEEEVPRESSETVASHEIGSGGT